MSDVETKQLEFNQDLVQLVNRMLDQNQQLIEMNNRIIEMNKRLLTIFELPKPITSPTSFDVAKLFR